MSKHIIKYYFDDNCVSEFIGDDETLADAFFHMSCFSLIPSNFTVTKRDAEHREYALRFDNGAVEWVEVHLNRPRNDINSVISIPMPGTIGSAKIV